MKLFKISTYIVEVDEQTVENLDAFFKNHFDVQQLHIEESEVFDDERVLDENCDLAFLEEHFKPVKYDNKFDRPLPKVGEIWRHFKTGKKVHVERIAQNTETQERYVVYRDTYTGKLWARPLDMFMSIVDNAKYPDATQKYRFERVKK